ncbi:MAG TPA: alpha/beta fold hydrolase [Desulfobulbaceae bacterium]|nr:alpha/beta fold hydrolase [Desulfobulbaceae bacterium]
MVKVELYQYPFVPKRFPIGSHALSYVDEGSGPAVVMVHGNPSWSYLYRNLITELRSRYRVIAPDHMGCGLSDKPENYPYRLKKHIENLGLLLDHLQIKRCVLVVHDWGGAIGMGWAGMHPDRIAGLVVLNSAAFPSTRIPLRINVCRQPFIGPLLVRGLNGFAGPATFMAVGNAMDPRIKEGFLAPYTGWNSRVAIHRFIQDIPMHKHHPSWHTLQRVTASLGGLREKPMLILWGGRDFCFNRPFYEEWRRRFPWAEGFYFEQAGHYVLEDVLPEVLTRIIPFVNNCHG